MGGWSIAGYGKSVEKRGLSLKKRKMTTEDYSKLPKDEAIKMWPISKKSPNTV